MSADPFEAARPRIRGLAYRMLGTFSEADDVAQEAWLRWQAAGGSHIHHPEAWLVTVATRICLDRLRSAPRTRETYPGPWLPEPIVADPGPEDAAELADSLTLGFLVLLDQLAPVERAVFVLADVFDVPFAEIAATVGRSEATCRQIASRARRRLRPGKAPDRPGAPERELLDGLLLAVASGDVTGVISRLAPDVVCLTDGGPNRRAARRPVVGAHRVARLLINLAARYSGQLGIQPATVGGETGVVITLNDEIDQVMAIEVSDKTISTIHFQRNPEKLTSFGHPVVLE
ncbi:MAG TPA: RNA polymerase sigma factor SigJ [Acidimicrobiales bacterium]|nr:RNA polymerase sigma factor SigJ [Acidimicrobiales bacterium]